MILILLAKAYRHPRAIKKYVCRVHTPLSLLAYLNFVFYSKLFWIVCVCVCVCVCVYVCMRACVRNDCLTPEEAFLPARAEETPFIKDKRGRELWQGNDINVFPPRPAK